MKHEDVDRPLNTQLFSTNHTRPAVCLYIITAGAQSTLEDDRLNCKGNELPHTIDTV